MATYLDAQVEALRSRPLNGGPYTFVWLDALTIRWEIRDDIHKAFMTLACAIICYRRLTT